MFDIGFWELTLIAIMGLVVLGPERLPVAIRTLKSWITGVRKFSDTVKVEITEELRIHELHANLKKAEQSNLEDLSPDVAESLKSLQEAATMVNEPYKKGALPVEDTVNSNDEDDRNIRATAVDESRTVSENSISNKPNL
jgi:sec-independent protein translocase protein TatB